MSKSDNQILILEAPRATQSHLQGRHDTELQGDWPQRSQSVRTSATPAPPYSILPPSVPTIALATIPENIPKENFAPVELGGVSTPVAKRPFWRTPKGIIILVIVAIVIIVAAVVGGVVGAKSNTKPSDTATPAATSDTTNITSKFPFTEGGQQGSTTTSVAPIETPGTSSAGSSNSNGSGTSSGGG